MIKPIEQHALVSWVLALLLMGCAGTKVAPEAPAVASPAESRFHGAERFFELYKQVRVTSSDAKVATKTLEHKKGLLVQLQEAYAGIRAHAQLISPFVLPMYAPRPLAVLRHRRLAPWAASSQRGAAVQVKWGRQPDSRARCYGRLARIRSSPSLRTAACFTSAEASRAVPCSSQVTKSTPLCS